MPNEEEILSQVPPVDEDAILQRYAERAASGRSAQYGPLSPSGFMVQQERTRALATMIGRVGLTPVYDKRVLEVGAGSGDNLLTLIQLGFFPPHLVGNDVDEYALQVARLRLPAAITLLPGDAAALNLAPASFDIVLQSTVFSSIPELEHRRRLARLMWDLAKPGGGVLWYDFVYNNPSNARVRGMPLRHVRELFPAGRLTTRRLTLAPPISRRVTQLHPSLYTVFNALPLLRTHILCWIEKPR